MTPNLRALSARTVALIFTAAITGILIVAGIVNLSAIEAYYRTHERNAFHERANGFAHIVS